MIKEWYIKIGDKKEGPYSILDLKRHPLLTPDTLAWKPGFKEWLPMRCIPELNSVFEDEKPQEEESEEEKPEKAGLTSFIDDAAMALRGDPPQLYFWILLIIIALLYAIYLSTHL